MAVNRSSSRPWTHPPTSPLPPLPTSAHRPPRTSSTTRAAKTPPPAPAGIPSTRKLGRFFSSSKSSKSTTITPPPLVLDRAASTTVPSKSQKPPPLSQRLQRSISYSSFPNPPTGYSSPSILPDVGRDGFAQRTVSLESAVHGLPFPRTTSSAPTTPRIPNAHDHTCFPFTSSDTIQEALDEETCSNGQTDENATDPSSATSARSSSSSSFQGGVVVSVRVRPESRESRGPASVGDWIVDGRAASVTHLGREGGDYVYDNVFTNQDTNAVVYSSAARQLVRRVMEGYHGTVFAYGMTGSGKTFSMQGTNSEPGIIPNAVADIFGFIRETPNREFLLRVSYLEIFNERIYDLLAQDAGQAGPPQETIKLREDGRRGVYASPLKEEIVQTPAQLLRLIGQGHQVRRTSSTQYNSRSSRSHAVIQIVIESRERSSSTTRPSSNRLGLVASTGFRVSTLNLIDLAGSERASDSKERRTEGGHINKSLLTLGTIISRLSGSKGKDSEKHLPYRDSKLTRLLQSALSGNALISILCTVQLGSDSSGGLGTNYVQETISTLKFAARARNNIVSHAKRTEEELDTRMLLAEIIELRKLVADEKSRSKRNKEDEIAKERELVAEQRHSEQMLEMQVARLALKERIEQLNRLVTTFKNADDKTVGSQYQRPLSSTIEACIQSLSSSSTLTLGAETVGSIGSIRSGPVGPTGDSSVASPDKYSFEDERSHLQPASRDDLQSQLVDKNRYIASLEEELIHAAKVSGASATSSVFTGDLHVMLLEKDAEIKELRERLVDKDRMLGALRSAVSRRHDTEAVEKVLPVAIPVSKFAQHRVVVKKPAPTKQASRAKSPVVGVSVTTSPTICSPNPKRIDEMTRLLREMASSISVPSDSSSPISSVGNGQTPTPAATPKPLRIVPAAARSGAGAKSPTPRFLTPISPGRHLSGWESDVERKRASLAKSAAGESEASSDGIRTHAAAANLHLAAVEGVVGLGLVTPPASPPASPPREIDVVVVAVPIPGCLPSGIAV